MKSKVAKEKFLEHKQALLTVLIQENPTIAKVDFQQELDKCNASEIQQMYSLFVLNKSS